MDEQLLLVTALQNSLAKDMQGYANIANGDRSWNREYNKTAIKRKIIMLRTELLKLERMVDND